MFSEKQDIGPSLTRPTEALEIPPTSPRSMVSFGSPTAHKKTVRTQINGITPKETFFISPRNKTITKVNSVLHQTGEHTSEYFLSKKSIVLENAKLTAPVLLTATPPTEIQINLDESNTNEIYWFHYPHREIKLITKVKISLPTTPWYRSETAWLSLKFKVEKKKELEYKIEKHIELKPIPKDSNEAIPAKTSLSFGLCINNKATAIVPLTPKPHDDEPTLTPKATSPLAITLISLSQSMDPTINKPGEKDTTSLPL